MTELAAQNAQAIIDRIVREEWGRVISALMSVCRDFDIAEDAMQDAVLAALKVWPAQGIPNSPQGWLLRTAQRRAIDRFRRDANFAGKRHEYEALLRLDAASATRRSGAAHPRRAPDAYLHLLPSGAIAGRPRGADAPHHLRHFDA